MKQNPFLFRLTEIKVLFLGLRWCSPYWKYHFYNAIVGPKFCKNPVLDHWMKKK